MKPRRAPRCSGSAAIVRSVSSVAAKRILQTTATFASAIFATCAGTVKTTWKYGTGRSSAARFSSHSSALCPRQLGQWRFRHES